MKQNQKSNLQQKLKRFLRDHKRSRREAAFQNLLAACLLLILAFVTVQGYAADHTVEKAVEDWCRSNMFGEGEICAVRTYEEEGVRSKDVIVSKHAEDGCRYEARVFLERENPLKWISCGSAWSGAPIPEKLQADEMGVVKGEDYAELPAEAISSLFMEFNQACGAEAILIRERNDKGGSESSDDSNDSDGTEKQNLSLRVWIYLSEAPRSMADAEIIFLVDLDTREVVSSVFKPVAIDGVTYEYWISEERMIFIAEKIKEVIS